MKTKLPRMINAQPGDKVVRTMAGVEMTLTVTAVDESFIYCGAWTFERDTGYEHDPDIEWGSIYGRTGSHITSVIKKEKPDVQP